MLSFNMPDHLILSAEQNARKEHRKVQSMLSRSRLISNVQINLNSVPVVNQFSLKLPEIKKIAAIISWSGVTSNNLYACEPVLA